MTEYQDLVTRLRDYRHVGFTKVRPSPLMNEAADAIETLTRERDSARVTMSEALRQADTAIMEADALRALLREAGEALEAICEPLRGNYSHQYDTLPVMGGANIEDLRFNWTLGDFRRARAVRARIKEAEKKND